MVALKALIKARSITRKRPRRTVSKKYINKAWLENYGRRYR